MVPIAVVGIAALFPGSVDKEGFWRDILAGRDLLTEVPRTHWLAEDWFDPDPEAPDRLYARRGAFLDAVPFDPLEFAMPPALLPSTDTSQLLALVVARQVLEDAVGTDFGHVDRDRVSVILGCASATELVSEMAGRLQRPVWVQALREMGLPESQVQAACARMAASYVPWTESTFPGVLGNVVAGRIANRFDLGGTNCVLDAACASSLLAVHTAAMELSLGGSDLVITGGVDTLNDPFMFMCFAKSQALSRTGDCRPFSAQADGTMLGEGLCMLALRRLADAERDGDRILAVLRGIGTSSDGRSRSIYAPRPEGQVKALRRAYEAAGYGPETVELVEAHGTGTPTGDAAEVAALRLVFPAPTAGAGGAGPGTPPPWCALGSVKSQVGHTKATAGAAGLFKAIMALHHKVLPPTIKVQTPNPALGLEGSPFYLNTRTRPWVRGMGHPRRASVSAFGFGGTNVHVTVEEYAGPGRRPARLRTAPSELILVGAGDRPALAARCRALAEAAARGGRLAPLAWESQVAAGPQAARLAVVAAGPAELASALRSVAVDLEGGGEAAGPPACPQVYLGEGPPLGDVALLFPGQGSQYLHMGADLAMHFDEARAIWDRAADLPLTDGARLDQVVFPLPLFGEEGRAAQAARLTATEWAQPAIAAASLSALAVLRAAGLTPAAAAGHSLGELSALCAAGAMDEATLLTLAARRGACVARAAGGGGGAMLAVGRGAAELAALLADWGLDLTLANRNAPDQTVFSGETGAIARAEQRLGALGVPSHRLRVSAAFHSPAMAAAAAAFRAHLEGATLSAPHLPVYANRDGTCYPGGTDAAALRERLAAHLTEPVRFVDQLEALYAAGVRVFVEVGPGAVLTGLAARTLRERPHLAVSVDAGGGHGVTGLWQALGRLWAAGVPLAPAALWGPYAPAPARPESALEVMISGANYGRPYPPESGTVVPPNPEPDPAAEAATGAGRGAPSLPPATAAMVWASDAAEPAAPPAPKPLPMRMPPAPPAGGSVTPASTAPPAPLRPSDAGVEPPVAPAPDAALLGAFQEWAGRTAEAHLAYQRAMTEGHQAFLRAAEQGLGALLGAVAVPPAASALAASVPAVVSAAPTTPMPAVPPLEELPRAPLTGVIALPLALAAGASPSGPAASVPAPAPAADPRAILLAVVSEKTGYPPEMLDLDLELEAGLGIDSIKRVEILAGLQERLPGLPEVQPADLAGLRTLGHILALAGRDGAAGTGSPPAVSAAAEPARVPAGPAPLPVAPAVLPPAPGTAHAATATPLGRWRVVAIPAAPSGFALPGLRGGRPWSILDGGSGVGPALEAALRARGAACRLSTSVGEEAAGVIFLGGLAEVAGPEAGAAIQRAAFAAAIDLAGRGGGGLVTVQDTGGDFGLSGRAGGRAWSGGLPGLVKSAACEWPDAAVKALDLERGDRAAEALAAAIAAELLAGGPEVEVGLRADGTRLTPWAQPGAAPDGEPVLPPGAVVVATGGARGIGAACLVALVRSTPLRLVILGRTPLDPEQAGLAHAQDEGALRRLLSERARAEGRSPTPAEVAAAATGLLAGREARRHVADLRLAGAQVRYLAVDVRDAEAVAAAIQGVRREWGPIAGVIHAAGALADRSLREKTPSDFALVFGTKVEGLRNLLAAVADDPLRLLCCFSSLAGRAGNGGQADYALANETLTQVVLAEAARRGQECVARSIAWGPWEGGMVTAALRAHFARRGVPLIPLEAGARGFVAETARDAGGAAVVVAAGGAALEVGRRRTMEVTIDAASDPQVGDHRIQGLAVLPLVMGLEWFARAATALRPGWHLAALRDVRVQRAVRLPEFAERGSRFLVRTTDGPDPDSLGLELAAADGGVHYTAVAELRAPCEPADPPAAPAEIPGGAWPWTAEEAYESGRLFHGPRFRALRRLEAVSAECASARAVGIAALDWPPAVWRTDPGLLDAGLQLALLWALHTLGRPSLPTAVERFVQYRAGPVAAEVRCLLRSRLAGSLRTVSDVVFVAPDGTTVALLQGLHMHLQEGGA